MKSVDGTKLEERGGEQGKVVCVFHCSLFLRVIFSHVNFTDYHRNVCHGKQHIQTREEKRKMIQ